MTSQKIIRVPTSGPGLYEITADLRHFTLGHGTGLVTVFVRHTSCSLIIQENADPDVRADLNAFFKRLVPDADDPSMRYLTHRMEGSDDMPAHIKAALTCTSLGIPVSEGEPLLGTWQGLYVFEHRTHPHERQVVLHFM